MNTVSITGNVVREPETRATKSEYGIVTFAIANNDESRKQQDGTYESVASFIDVTYFTKNPSATLKMVHKGTKVLIQGRLKQDRWQDDSGNNRSKVHIIAEDRYNSGWGITVMGSRQTDDAAYPNDFNDDEIPF